MEYDTSAEDFRAIADESKKSKAFKKLAGTPDDDGDEGPGDESASEDRALGDAYAAFAAKDEAGFKEAMAAAMRACYESMK